MSRGVAPMALCLGLLSSVLLSPVLLACGSVTVGGGLADGPEQPVVTRKLQRRWLLSDFKPTDPLDVVLAGFLQGQLGHLVIDVAPGTLRAVGPAVDVIRNYEVVRPLYDRADVVVFSDDGTPHEVSVELRSEQLFFACRTAPWKGSGTLVPAGEPDPLFGM